MQLIIKSLNHQGLGVAHHEGKTVFVSNALPGEEVLVKITKQHRRYDEAQAIEIITPSNDRITPVCPHFLLCGGCSLQHMSSDAQISLKQNVLLEQLHHIANVVPKIILPSLQGPTEGYRRKARLGVKFVDKKDKLLIGFREQNNRYLADLEMCKVLMPQVGHSFEPLRAALMQLSNYKSIAQIELCAGDEVVAIIVRHLEALTENDLQVLINYGKTNNIHIYLQPKGPDTVHLIWPEHSELSYGHDGITFKFNPLDFTQVNSNINQQMVQAALTQLDLSPSDHVLDLFSGLGNFTLPIAKRAAHVTGVEGSDQMVKQLLANAKLNNLDNVDGYMFDLFKPIDYQPWVRAYDKLLLDPPRAGALEIAQQIKRFQAKKIVYISCHLATLARDTKVILEQGYQLQAAGVIDMFPHTMHAESMAVFVKQK
ncbi:MAG: 23S rRNA (uracil(1939)-C(5))-methyltransferase RlmD [Legionellales bacterium]|jgi:23S rRNA (uracil1939-C5)-methyltransferase